jgi:hypothetical protein
LHCKQEKSFVNVIQHGLALKGGTLERGMLERGTLERGTLERGTLFFYLFLLFINILS